MLTHQQGNRYTFDLVHHEEPVMVRDHVFARPENALARWAKETSNYPYYGTELTKYQTKYASMAQLLWRATKRVGFGCALGYSKRAHGKLNYVVVANFDPPGNQICQYRDNVLPRNDTKLYRDITGEHGWQQKVCNK